MIVRISNTPRHPSLDLAAFRTLWDEHSEMGGTLPGRLGYVRNVPCVQHGRYLLPYPGFDASAETLYENRDTMANTFSARPAGYQDHTSRLLDVSRYSWLVGDRQIRVDGDAPAGFVKLMTFMRLHPACSVQELATALEHQSEVVAESGPIRHEQVVRHDLPNSSVGFDAVDMIWFESPHLAVDYVGSAAGYDAQEALRGYVLGVERVVVLPEVHTSPDQPG